MVSGEGGGAAVSIYRRTPGVTLLCFGRLKGDRCDLEGWSKSSDDVGSLSQERLHLGTGPRGTSPCPRSLSSVSAFLHG